MIVDYIKKLRNGSNEEKRRFLIISTSLVLLAIVILWLTYGFNLIPKEARPTVTKTEKTEGVFSGFFKEASQDLTKVKNDVTNILGDFFEGKYDPEEIPADLERVIIDDTENLPLELPQLD
jgi:hypothetical protein